MEKKIMIQISSSISQKMPELIAELEKAGLISETYLVYEQEKEAAVKEFFFIEEGVTAIEDIINDAAAGRTMVEIRDLSGRLLPTLQRGLNIVRMSDGTVRKVMVK